MGKLLISRLDNSSSNPNPAPLGSEYMVQEVGFEPTKQYVLGPKPSAFDQAGQLLLKVGVLILIH